MITVTAFKWVPPFAAGQVRVDLTLASVIRVAGHADLLADGPTLAAYRARCLDRPGFRKAVADQCRDIAAHGPRDMGRDPAMFAEPAVG